MDDLGAVLLCGLEKVELIDNNTAVVLIDESEHIPFVDVL